MAYVTLAIETSPGGDPKIEPKDFIWPQERPLRAATPWTSSIGAR